MHILAYSHIFRHVQKLVRYILCNPNIFRTLIYSKLETKAYSEPCQTSMMEHFAKIVKNYGCFCKLKSFLHYQLFTFSTFKNKSLFFTPEVFILCKYSNPGGGGHESGYTHAML